MSEINEKYTIEYFRLSGQKISEQDRGVRVTCKDTGAWAECSEHKIRYENIDNAILEVERIKSGFKVIVAGGRDFDDYDDYEVLRERCDFFLKTKSNIEIVSGAAKGADSLGERYANERGYSLTKFPADWETHGKSAGAVRNAKMAAYADALIAFWDGRSKGTKNMIDVMRIIGKPFKIVKYGR